MGEEKKRKERQREGERSPETAFAFEVAFERGNFVAARRLARAAATSGQESRRAQDVLQRVALDPVPLLVFGAGLVTILVVGALGLG